MKRKKKFLARKAAVYSRSGCPSPNRAIWLVWYVDETRLRGLAHICQTKKAATACEAYFAQLYGENNVWSYAETPLSDWPKDLEGLAVAIAASE